MKKKRNEYESLISDYLRDVVGIIRITDGTISVIERLFATWLSNRSIDINNQVYIPVKQLHSLSARQYATIRNTACRMKDWYDMNNGKCKLIIGWDYKFDILCMEILKLRGSIAKENTKIKLSYYNTHSCNITALTPPGGSTAAYHQGINKETGMITSHRWYNPLQNMDEEQRNITYEGCLDLDIVACFPTLFHQYVFKEVGRETPGTYYAMIYQPELFLQMLIESDVWVYPIGWNKNTKKNKPRAKAKQMRSRMFNFKDDKPLKKSGLVWYDKLCQFIYNQMMDSDINNGHLFFTLIEQRIVQIAIDIIGEDNVHMRMHDGFITKQIPDIDIVLQEIFKETGLQWSVKAIKSE